MITRKNKTHSSWDGKENFATARCFSAWFESTDEQIIISKEASKGVLIGGKDFLWEELKEVWI